MSYSITVPQGPANEFADRAKAAVDVYAKQLATNDVKLDDIAQGQLDPQIDAAGKLAAQLYGDADYDVVGTLVGHVNPDNATGTTCSIYLGTVAKGAPAS